ARSPIFCSYFLHHLDLKIAFDNKLLQPRVLGLKLPQPANVARLEAAEALAPGVDRLLADPVPLGHRRYWFAICLADDCNHLLFREPTLPHCSLRNREPVSQLIAGPKIRGQVRDAVWIGPSKGGVIRNLPGTTLP